MDNAWALCMSGECIAYIACSIIPQNVMNNYVIANDVLQQQTPYITHWSARPNCSVSQSTNYEH